MEREPQDGLAVARKDVLKTHDKHLNLGFESKGPSHTHLEGSSWTHHEPTPVHLWTQLLAGLTSLWDLQDGSCPPAVVNLRQLRKIPRAPKETLQITLYLQDVGKMRPNITSQVKTFHLLFCAFLANKFLCDPNKFRTSLFPQPSHRFKQ